MAGTGTGLWLGETARMQRVLVASIVTLLVAAAVVVTVQPSDPFTHPEITVIR